MHVQESLQYPYKTAIPSHLWVFSLQVQLYDCWCYKCNNSSYLASLVYRRIFGGCKLWQTNYKNTFGDINFGKLEMFIILNKVFWLKKLWQIYGNLPYPPMFPPSKVSLYMVLCSSVQQLYIHAAVVSIIILFCSSRLKVN